jgi:DNA-binding MarR family transcriptional regulator
MAEAVFTTPVALVRLAHLIGCVYAEACAEYGLSVPQAQLLCVLKDQGRGMGEISAMLRLDKSSVTGLVERVERRQYLRRAISATDRRAIQVTLTPRGKRLTDAFYAEVSRRVTDLVTHLPTGDRDRLTRIASRVVLDEGVPDIFGATAS